MVFLIKITDEQKALYNLVDLEFCRIYIRDELRNCSYVYDRLLGYDETFLETED